jgi:uncharacterized damage-inducible protein DinB
LLLSTAGPGRDDKETRRRMTESSPAAPDAVDIIRRLHAHRAWVNAKLLDAAQALSQDELRRPLSIGQGSVWKSLLHLHAAEYVWLESLLGNEQALLPGDVAHKLPGNQEGQGGIRSLAELSSRWRDLESRWQQYLSGLDPKQLDEQVSKVSSNGLRRSTRRSDILMHVCTHAHYTTAQVINMLRQLGVQGLPDPMLITLARQESPAAG